MYSQGAKCQRDCIQELSLTPTSWPLAHQPALLASYPHTSSLSGSPAPCQGRGTEDFAPYSDPVLNTSLVVSLLPTGKPHRGASLSSLSCFGLSDSWPELSHGWNRTELPSCLSYNQSLISDHRLGCSPTLACGSLQLATVLDGGRNCSWLQHDLLKAPVSL